MKSAIKIPQRSKKMKFIYQQSHLKSPLRSNLNVKWHDNRANAKIYFTSKFNVQVT